MSSISLNDRKTSVMRRAQSQRVLGVVVNDRLNVDDETSSGSVPNSTKRVRGPAVSNRTGVVDYRSHLGGRIEWIGQLTLIEPNGSSLRSIRSIGLADRFRQPVSVQVAWVSPPVRCGRAGRERRR